jgi:hypothetical protein
MFLLHSRSTLPAKSALGCLQMMQGLPTSKTQLDGGAAFERGFLGCGLGRRATIMATERPACETACSPRYAQEQTAHAQEQTQIITIAIGKPTAIVPAIVRVNAKNGFSSGRACNDMSLTPIRMNRPPPRCAMVLRDS